MLEKWSRTTFIFCLLLEIGLVFVLGRRDPRWLWLFVALGPLAVIGIYDMLQTRHTILRNFPLLGHFRYLFESIRPEIHQYFIESDDEEHPFSREKRSIVYQRSKGSLDTFPFGTHRDVYRVGYEWINHSIRPVEADPDNAWVQVGGPDCDKPYRASLLNISAMSFGALSANAIRALSQGAKEGGFYHNTGEGGISPYHLEGGADLVWQIGTGYFGCRDAAGNFCPDTFAERASQDAVKMIEIKISQGAKPGHGGILPAAKVSSEIAAIRAVPLGQDVLSPPGHSAFSTPLELLQFVATLRRLSGGKPVGFKFCVGEPREFYAICKAMLETGVSPDFITVDGGEGGSGAAPLELTNSVGFPLYDGLAFVHRALVGAGLRGQVRLVAAGKITTGFHLVTRLALGADICCSARGMMFSLGCIQALKCNSNSCPTGIATQNPRLARGLVVADKAPRVTAYQRATVRAALELMGISGTGRQREELRRRICRRTDSGQHQTFAELYPCLETDSLTQGGCSPEEQSLWQQAQTGQF
ncbi:MAG: FMN-binding glutamate synthase family protein [Deltaproteobacteria bacterium]|nr:FMN-binding glutamate synthase family protein [Deltaproteobacteria bacterium]